MQKGNLSLPNENHISPDLVIFANFFLNWIVKSLYELRKILPFSNSINHIYIPSGLSENWKYPVFLNSWKVYGQLETEAMTCSMKRLMYLHDSCSCLYHMFVYNICFIHIAECTYCKSIWIKKSANKCNVIYNMLNIIFACQYTHFQIFHMRKPQFYILFTHNFFCSDTNFHM